MKKIIEIVKKHDNIFLFLYMMVAFSVYIFVVKLMINDELWNFSNIYKTFYGYKLYKDLNVIITPMFYYIGQFIFLILGNNYISFRIYNILIYSTLYTVIYILFKKMKIEKKSALIYVACMFFITKSIIPTGANYNVLVMIFVIIGIMLQLNKDTLKNNILDGIIIFCIFLSKQNVAVYYCIALILMYILQMKFEKVKIKQVLKNICIKGITCLILLVVLSLYLNINNQLYDFISYTMLGINEFGRYNGTFSFATIVLLALSLVSIGVSILLINIKKVNKEIKKVNLYMISYCIILLLIVFPIVNRYHTIIGALLSILLLFYNLHNIFFVEFIDKKIINKIMPIFISCITIYFIFYNIYGIYKYQTSGNINYDIKPYNNIIIDNKLKNKINTICEYIKENEKQNIETKIISYEANLYMNVLEKNNKNMDLPFLGNLGKEGEEGLILEVRNLKQGTRILISKEKEFYQDSDKFRNTIINEYNRIGEIENFYIYEK